MKTAYINGIVFTGNTDIKEAFIVEDNLFTIIDSTEKVMKQVDENTTIIDLEGQFVTAGFNDSHMHVLNYGMTLDNAYLADVQSIAKLKEVMKQFIKENNFSKESWIKGRGWNQDFFNDEKRFPTRDDLDEISTTNPIVITRACGHVLVCNSKAIEILNLDATMPAVEGGEFEIVAGKLNGVFKENAMSLVYDGIKQPSIENIKNNIINAMSKLNSYGITSVQSDDLLSVDNYHDVIIAFKQLEEEGKMTIRVYEQSHFTNLKSLKEFIDLGYVTGVGDEFFKFGPLKMMADGSLGARTALMSKPYADKNDTNGIKVFEQNELNEMVDYASKNGMQVAIHAIGDKAMDMVIDAIENTLKLHPRKNHRHGIVHCQITRKDILEKYQQLELQAYIQSIFLDYDITIVKDRVGELAQDSYAFKMLYDFNHASNGSDCPVELPDVLKGMQCAITRCSSHDKTPFIPTQALTVEEAIKSFTINGAYASFEEDIKGLIAPNYVADFVILDKNLLEIEANTIKDCQIMATYLNGKCVYQRSN